MGQNADTVAVEVEARLNAASARATEAQFDQSMNRIQGSAGKAEQSLKRLFDPAGYRQDRLLTQLQGTGKAIEGAFDKPMLNAVTRTRQLGVQIGQLGSSLGSGISPMTVFAQQASDFAYVLGGARGAAGKVATFFSGPWGAALLSAGVVVGVMASKIHFMSDELGDATDKLKEHAHTAEVGERAQAVFGNTIDGVTDALRKNRDAITALDDADKSATRTALEHALAEAEKAKRIRATTIAILEQREADLGSAQQQTFGAAGGAGAGGAVSVYARRAEEARVAVEKAKAAAAEADKQVVETTAKFMAEVITRQTNPLDALHARYDRLVKDATNRAVAEGLVGKALEKEVAQRTTILRLQERSAEKALQEANRHHPEGVQQVSTFIMPVSGPITSGFGPRTPPTRGASSFHPAIDIGAPAGTPVKAAAGGVVITAGRMGGLGNVVIVDHGGGTISEYGHLSATLATVGQRVGQGDIIGKVGSTGISTGPHLDYRVRVGGRYVDPRGGKFATDEIAAGTKANQLAEQAQREADRAAAREGAFNREMAGLEQQLLGAQRTKLLSAAEALELSEAQIIAQRDARNDGYASAAKAHQISDTDAKLLTEKSNQLATAQTLKLYADEGVRVAQLNAQLDAQRQQDKVAQAQSDLQLAKTGGERRAAALALLDAEIELERIAQQRIVDATAAGTAEHELAVLKLSQLDAEKARGTAAINANPSNMSPAQAYAHDLSQTAGQINDSLEAVAVDGLKNLNDGLTDAIMGAKTLGQVFDDVAKQIIAALIKIAIQQMIIKPLAQLLGGGGGGGDPFSSFLSMFGGGGGGGSGLGSFGDAGVSFPTLGFASGGSVRGGRPILVGERGPEIWTPPNNGQIVPNHALASLGMGGGRSTVEVFVTAGEYFDAHVGRVTGPIIARASIQAMQGGSALAGRKLATRTMHGLE